MRKEAKRAKSIRDGDNDHAFVREPVAPVQGHRGRSVDVTPAIYPDDHWNVLLRALRRGPDVKVKTIFTHDWRRLAWHRHTILHARRGKRISFTCANPGCDRCWCAPTQIADRRCSKLGHLVNH